MQIKFRLLFVIPRFHCPLKLSFYEDIFFTPVSKKSCNITQGINLDARNFYDQ